MVHRNSRRFAVVTIPERTGFYVGVIGQVVDEDANGEPVWNTELLSLVSDEFTPYLDSCHAYYAATKEVENARHGETLDSSYIYHFGSDNLLKVASR